MNSTPSKRAFRTSYTQESIHSNIRIQQQRDVTASTVKTNLPKFVENGQRIVSDTNCYISTPCSGKAAIQLRNVQQYSANMVDFNIRAPEAGGRSGNSKSFAANAPNSNLQNFSGTCRHEGITFMDAANRRAAVGGNLHWKPNKTDKCRYNLPQRLIATRGGHHADARMSHPANFPPRYHTIIQQSSNAAGVNIGAMPQETQNAQIQNSLWPLIAHLARQSGCMNSPDTRAPFNFENVRRFTLGDLLNYRDSRSSNNSRIGQLHTGNSVSTNSSIPSESFAGCTLNQIVDHLNETRGNNFNNASDTYNTIDKLHLDELFQKVLPEVTHLVNNHTNDVTPLESNNSVSIEPDLSETDLSNRVACVGANNIQIMNYQASRNENDSENSGCGTNSMIELHDFTSEESGSVAKPERKYLGDIYDNYCKENNIAQDPTSMEVRQTLFSVTVEQLELKHFCDLATRRSVDIWSTFCFRYGHSEACLYGRFCKLRDKEQCEVCGFYCLTKHRTFARKNHEIDCISYWIAVKMLKRDYIRYETSILTGMCEFCRKLLNVKSSIRNRFYGVLPNCNHMFCVECAESFRTDLPNSKYKNIIICRKCGTFSPFYAASPCWPVRNQKRKFLKKYLMEIKTLTCKFCTEGSNCELYIGSNICYHRRTIRRKDYIFAL